MNKENSLQARAVSREREREGNCIQGEGIERKISKRGKIERGREKRRERKRERVCVCVFD